jgi:hypothetical protein
LTVIRREFTIEEVGTGKGSIVVNYTFKDRMIRAPAGDFAGKNPGVSAKEVEA